MFNFLALFQTLMNVRQYHRVNICAGILWEDMNVLVRRDLYLKATFVKVTLHIVLC